MKKLCPVCCQEEIGDDNKPCKLCSVLTNMEQSVLKAITRNIVPLFYEEIEAMLLPGKLKDRLQAIREKFTSSLH